MKEFMPWIIGAAAVLLLAWLIGQHLKEEKKSGCSWKRRKLAMLPSTSSSRTGASPKTPGSTPPKEKAGAHVE